LAAPDCEVWKALRAFVDARAVVELQSAGKVTAAATARFHRLTDGKPRCKKSHVQAFLELEAEFKEVDACALAGLLLASCPAGLDLDAFSRQMENPEHAGWSNLRNLLDASSDGGGGVVITPENSDASLLALLEDVGSSGSAGSLSSVDSGSGGSGGSPGQALDGRSSPSSVLPTVLTMPPTREEVLSESEDASSQFVSGDESDFEANRSLTPPPKRAKRETLPRVKQPSLKVTENAAFSLTPRSRNGKKASNVNQANILRAVTQRGAGQYAPGASTV